MISPLAWSYEIQDGGAQCSGCVDDSNIWTFVFKCLRRYIRLSDSWTFSLGLYGYPHKQRSAARDLLYSVDSWSVCVRKRVDALIVQLIVRWIQRDMSVHF